VPGLRTSRPKIPSPSREKDELAVAICGVLDRRLRPTSDRPIALGLSGGGDSVALLLAAHAWAGVYGRRLLVLSVDHRLQPQSAAWTTACGARARSLGAEFRALAWEGPKPAAGLAAAARAARHRLLAEAAREAGAHVLLLGHTADDVLESQDMRRAGSTTPDPREWSPSPAWPEGRGLFLLRPMLGLRRAALRDWLQARGERWIEDPANADPRFARARARAGLRDGAAPGRLAEGPVELAAAFAPLAGGGFEAMRARLAEAPIGELARALALACVCAGGGARLPRAGAAQRLAHATAGGGPLAATLAGARVLADAACLRIVRDAGEAARGGLAPLALTPGAPVVWDGRFEVAAQSGGLEVRRLAGLAARLPADQQRALAGLPAAVRPALPAVLDASGAVTSPLLGASPAAVASLTEARLSAAARLVAREPS
jgi:tRNA(Ile)-lysidine synthase